MKAHELTGAALDWAVAKCEGVRLSDAVQVHGKFEIHFTKDDGGTVYSPSTNWAQGGPIIEREGIAVWRDRDGWIANFPGCRRYKGNVGYIDVDDVDGNAGPTPLVAAMRAYAESKIGFDIDIPPDILKGD